MKQAKKIITRMLINNWGGISHRMMEFHEYVNLFSGKSGSGKSTVMDAVQVVLYGSMSGAFLNKAADDAKNRRSVMSYLRGAQKDGTSNRADQDFRSTLALEIADTGLHTKACFGVVFEIGRTDTDISGKYTFFSHAGPMPEDGYLEDGVPYSRSRIRSLCEERKAFPDNRGRMDINRIYLSNESYVASLYDGILGGVDPGRLMTMEKSAIALRMTNGTGQFIRDYMFPKSQESAIGKISDQLGAYREIRERIEDLEQRIGLLDRIGESHGALLRTRADIVRTETVLKYIEIESAKAHLEARTQDLQGIREELGRLEQEKDRAEAGRQSCQEELTEVKAALQASDYGQKEREMEALQETIRLLAGNSRQWRGIVDGLRAWEQDEQVTGYVSNFALQLIGEFQKGKVTEEQCGELHRRLMEAREAVSEELDDLKDSLREASTELKEKKEILEDLRNDRKHYDSKLTKARAQLESALSNLYGRRVPVSVFADLFDITDDRWRNAVEGRLARVKHSLIVPPEYALDAAKMFGRMNRYQEVDLINTAAIRRDAPKAEAGTLYEAVQAQEPYVDLCLRQYLGRIVKCETVEELHQVRNGVMPDCYSYSGYMFRHLKEADYTARACIGTKVSREKLASLEDEVRTLEERIREEARLQDSLKRALDFETLQLEPEQAASLSQAASRLEEAYRKQDRLAKEIEELKNGTLTAELTARRDALEAQAEELQKMLSELHERLMERTKACGSAESDVKKYEETLDGLTEGFVENPELTAEVTESLKTATESAYRSRKRQELARLKEQEEAQKQERTRARNHFNQKYPAYDFADPDKDNDGYEKALEQCRRDFEPKYKAEFEKQCALVYASLRDNVIAAIHGEIKAAYRHAREINRLLSRIRFSDSVYQIEILPARNENGQFYEMLTAAELDSKVTDDRGYEGQLSLLEDDFYRKYERQIGLLTEKFMPPDGEDGAGADRRRQEMERYADYRNYLTFSMYERVEDEGGAVRKNPVDEMAGRDSGGEGQNPKYVALLAGFAMLYMQQSSRDSKVRLVLLDEAFSKMDKERSEVCLRYARELELQLIVCVPDERLQSLIRNVDCVYGFRRHRNQITMMHIDKGGYLDMIAGRDGEADGGEKERGRREKDADPVGTGEDGGV
ncbi:MAG: SbcC/MukB-like Walker B domain-containing protein [Eubacteriales bacterium]|nr:SbcC/MukB-like Walker B domain-containing protein [Eubacteriales bacterium]